MRKKISNALVVGLLMIGSYGLGVCTVPLKVAAETTSFSTFLQVYDLLKSEYVNAQVKDNELVYGAIKGMLGSLDDPYTRFMDPKAFQAMQEERSGSFGGIGIQIGMKDNKLTVIAPLEGTPAFRAGLKAGDHILEIDGKATRDMAEAEAVSLIRGVKGTAVKLKVRGPKAAQARLVPIIRDTITTSSVRTQELENNIGYIRLNSFMSNDAATEMKSALMRFKNKSGLIVDLRGNPGGLLPNAIDIGSMFVKSGPIVQTINRDGVKQSYNATGQPIVDDRLPVVLLIDGGSASASEIVAGALQDNRRATLIGTKTFGKGLVQTVHSLSDGSGVAITTQKYLTSAGHDIHKRGITPDIKVELPEIKHDQEGRPDAASLRAFKDTQLEQAKAFIRSRIVKRG